MLTKLREPFGKAGLIVAIVALIAALGGGAYAASGGLTGKQKKEVTKIAQTEAKKLAGKPGANGTNGTPGAKGDTGAGGSNGTNGTNGAPGKSVEAFEIPPGQPACGGLGGAEYEVEGSGEAAEICNGEAGSPWAVGGLPKGATETGVWTVTGSEATTFNGELYAPISFSVPLRAPITDSTKVHFVGENGDGVNCKGSVANPTAPEGSLCVYKNEVAEMTYFAIKELEGLAFEQASKAGAYLVFNEVENHAFGRGSWAVTGN
jgi:hypothetical protein